MKLFVDCVNRTLHFQQPMVHFFVREFSKMTSATNLIGNQPPASQSVEKQVLPNLAVSHPDTSD